MDDRKNSNSLDAFDARPGSETAPIIADLRRETPEADAFRCSPDDVEQGRNDPASARHVVTYCFHGHELSQGVAAAFRIMGVGLPLP
jgi:hypothetical protein